MSKEQSPYLSGQAAVMYLKNEIRRQFGSDMRFQEEKSAFERHGWFLLQFWYMPKSYTIHFEGEFNGFNVRITKDDGAYIALSQLIDYSNTLTERDLCDAIEKLKSVLNTEIAFYKIINGKRCQEINGVYRRIKR